MKEGLGQLLDNGNELVRVVVVDIDSRIGDSGSGDVAQDGDISVSEQDKKEKRLKRNMANEGRVAGNAKFIVARNPAPGFKLKNCGWCNQRIEAGTLYVKQDRYLYYKGKWYPSGNFHDKCFGLAGDY